MQYDRRKQSKSSQSEQGLFGSSLEPSPQEGLSEFVDQLDEDASTYAGDQVTFREPVDAYSDNKVIRKHGTRGQEVSENTI